MTGVILSGGRNSRMGGTNKAFLEVAGRRIIEGTVGLLKEIFQEVIIVTNTPLAYLDLNVTLVTDILPDKGPLGGLYTGLFWASHPRAFVCACDMPFLDSRFIEYMAAQAPPYDIVVPATVEAREPLHAIYGKGCLPAIKHNLDRERFKIVDFYKGHRTLTIIPDIIEKFAPVDKMFLNLNSYDDFAGLGKNENLSPVMPVHMLIQNIPPKNPGFPPPRE